MVKCILLNYHSIIDPAVEGNHYDPLYSIKREDFIKHLEIIKSSGFSILPIDELFSKDLSDGNYVSISFDDGHPSDCYTVYPLLKKFEFKASFFVTLKNVPEDCQRWDVYREMSLDGHYVGTHGITHRYLSDLRFEDQFKELDESKRIIEKQIGVQKQYFSLPGGKYNSTTIKLAKSLGYSGLLTTNFGIVKLDSSSFLIRRCSIGNNYSLDKFEKLLTFDSKFIRKSTSSSKIKKLVQSIIGTKFSDSLNYNFRS